MSLREWVARVQDDEALAPSALQEPVIAALRDIYDPEIPINIYDLGLIYRVDIDDQGVVEIDMTLTAPGCPVAQHFPGWVEDRVNQVEGVTGTHVELVWDPPWSPEVLTDEVKLELGLL